MAIGVEHEIVGAGWYGEERTRIVRLCGQITGQPGIAEDLAQETLAEAWRLRHRLTDPAGSDRWLTAIARNVCRRWMRSEGRERGRQAEATVELPDEAGWDLDVELERGELVALLDQALALLPPETRGSLIARYVDELPHAEIANRLGISEGAVAMRLQRGRLMLRRYLTTDLREQAEAYGLVQGSATWQETSIWCPICGQCRLHGRFDHEKSTLTLRCEECYRRWSGEIAHAEWAECLNAVKGYRAAMSKLNRMTAHYFRQALAVGHVPCQRCGQPAHVRLGRPNWTPPALKSIPGVFVSCAICGHVPETTLHALIMALPAGRQFQKDHPRTRVLPVRTIELADQSALVIRLESVTDSASLEVVSAQNNFDVLAIHHNPSVTIVT